LGTKYFYNAILLICDFIVFTVKASSIDTTDSPFISNFINYVLRKKQTPDEVNLFNKIELYRKQLLRCNDSIHKNDFGAGSKVQTSAQLKVKQIVKSSVSNQSKCKLLYRITQFFEVGTALELGSSLGISSQYIAINSSLKSLLSIEGDQQIFKIAQDKNPNSKTTFLNQLFDETLSQEISKSNKYDMVLIDGDHQYDSTIRYVNLCKKLLNDQGFLLLDDIYWSTGMKKAWEELKKDRDFNVSIDMFHFGLLMNHAKVKECINIKLMPFGFRWQIGLFR
jgi:predicted O-methyltransferase YrrM